MPTAIRAIAMSAIRFKSQPAAPQGVPITEEQRHTRQGDHGPPLSASACFHQGQAEKHPQPDAQGQGTMSPIPGRSRTVSICVAPIMVRIDAA